MRASDALDGARPARARRSGPLPLEVIEPLQKLRFVCDGDDHGLGFDLTWEGSFPAVDEIAHLWRPTAGSCSTPSASPRSARGRASSGVDGTTHTVDPRHLARHPRPVVGHPPRRRGRAAGRAAAEPIEGFWWIYVPLRFDDFAIVVIVQEDPDGHRVLNDAVRVWPARPGRHPSSSAGPGSTSTTGPAPATPSGATIHLTEPDGTPLTPRGRDARATSPSTPAPATAATRGPTAPGRAATGSRASRLDLTDPAVAGHGPVRPHRPRRPGHLDGAEGWGLFELGTFGRHDPSGFADYGTVAP